MGETNTWTHVIFWSMFLLNPLILSVVDVYLARQHQRSLLWVSSIAMVLVWGAIYLQIRIGNTGDYATAYRHPAQFLPPPFYFGLPALLIARRSVSADVSESWSMQLLSTLKTGFLSLLGAFPLGLLFELATHNGAWL